MSYNISSRTRTGCCPGCLPKEVQALIASYPKLVEAIDDAKEAAEEAREAARHMIPGDNTVGTDQIQDGSIEVQDLSETVKQGLSSHRYNKDEETMYIGGITTSSQE